mgnify:CR=1 FL=1
MKKNMTKVMAMGMVLTMLAGTTVFAVDGTATNDMAATGGEMDVKEEGFREIRNRRCFRCGNRKQKWRSALCS